ncbi:hypothetical protein LSM04_006741 [Trypanosoma melophagium]|uniref:uncharacterized protein n=1 Tax=Trypanosoma melophagium TaxID=715481 RepID=UPI003519EB61|nr:hypothetical protein LSM04_006741 [Trypanosoma melophagium]
MYRYRCSYTLRRGKVPFSSTSSLFLVFIFLMFNTFLWQYQWERTPRTVKNIMGELPFKEKEDHHNKPNTAVVVVDANTDTLNDKKEEEEELEDRIAASKASEEVVLHNVEQSSLLHVQYTGENKLFSLNDIVKKLDYKKGVTPSICPPLPENVTIPLEETFELGMLREFLGGMYHPEHCKWLERYNYFQNNKVKENDIEYMNKKNDELKNCREEAEKAKAEIVHHAPKYAYVMMVSNHRYLDGAMVLADSIRQHSPFTQNRSAEIVLMINEHIKEDMFPLLQVTFDRVKIFHALQVWAKKSAYRATFDKIYIFTLSDYTGGIVFIDADTLITDNPDFLLQLPEKIAEILNSTEFIDGKPNFPEVDKYPITDPEWNKIMKSKKLPHLFAVGDKKYFQTGLIILQPSMKIFLDLYLEFRLGSYGYNRWQARDGILFRTCFRTIGELAVRPPAVHHFTGTPKPWFNLERLDHSMEPMGVYMKRQLPQSWRDHAYRYEWWTRYELLHRESFYNIEMETRKIAGSLQDTTLHFWEKKLGKGRTNIPNDTHITKYGGTMLLRKPTSTLPLPLGLHSREEATKASPKEYMWMMRFSRDVEYLRPTRAHIAKLRTYSFPIASADDLNNILSFLPSCKENSPPSVNTSDGYCPAFATLNTGKDSVVYAFALRNSSEIETKEAVSGTSTTVLDKEGGEAQAGAVKWIDCDTTCRQFNLKCDEAALLDTRISDCQNSETVGTMANGLIRCKRCLPHFKEGAPFVVFRDGEENKNSSFVQYADVCFFNAWTRYALPRCNASVPRISLYDLHVGDFVAPLCACR